MQKRDLSLQYTFPKAIWVFDADHTQISGSLYRLQVPEPLPTGAAQW